MDLSLLHLKQHLQHVRIINVTTNSSQKWHCCSTFYKKIHVENKPHCEILYPELSSYGLRQIKQDEDGAQHPGIYNICRHFLEPGSGKNGFNMGHKVNFGHLTDMKKKSL